MHKFRVSACFICSWNPMSRISTMDTCIEDIHIREDTFWIASSYIHGNFYLSSSFSLSLSLSLSLSPAFFSLSLSFRTPDVARIYSLTRDFECNVMSFFSESAYAPTYVCPVSPIVIQPASINRNQWNPMGQLQTKQELFGKPRIIPSLTRIQSSIIDIWFRIQTFSDMPLNCFANLRSYINSWNISANGFYDCLICIEEESARERGKLNVIGISRK